jgi:hypothetical protein
VHIIRNVTRGPGRRKISWLKNLWTWHSKPTTELFSAAVNKDIIAGMITNIRKEYTLDKEEEAVLLKGLI